MIRAKARFQKVSHKRKRESDLLSELTVLLTFFPLVSMPAIHMKKNALICMYLLIKA